MILIWGTVDGEYKPMMFDASAIPEEEDVTRGDLIRLIDHKKVRVKRISVRFVFLADKYEGAVLSWYGLKDYPKIIGIGRYEEVIF